VDFLHVTQAAVSARVQALEAEIGRRLFVRNKAGAHLTTAGHEFLPDRGEQLARAN